MGDRLRAFGVPPTAVPAVELLTSELVGNSVVHATGSQIELRVRITGVLVLVEVSDTSPNAPILRDAAPEVPGGEGMRLVDMLATAWGQRPHDLWAKTVWFSLAAWDAQAMSAWDQAGWS
jgi:two-component sensor histidine kinase